jgi:uncharacterized protein with GYD domain
MPTYISLMNFTDQGIRVIKESPARAGAFEVMADKYGVKLVSLHYTVGSYDIIAIMDAPDEETVTAVLLNVGSLGNVRSQTLRGFSSEEMQGILENMA